MSKELNNNMNVTEKTEENLLSNYHFTQTIGQGNFGKVKLAIYKPTKEQFAVKILTKAQIQNKNEMHLVQRELDIIRNFDHFNVIYVHQIIEDKRNYYIIMDYCENGELFDYIATKQHLDEEEASLFFYQLINGVEYIHSKSIVHRDLKPENLLLTKTKTLRIIDFGLSRYYGSDTILSTKCGSPSYAAPEIINGNAYNGFKTDVWCCGIILYAMLCGYLPFEGENNKELFKIITKCKVLFPHYVSTMGKKMVKEMLNPNPEKRIVIADIKKREFYLKGKEQYESLVNRKKKKIMGLHLVNSNSGINPFKKFGFPIPITTATKLSSPKNEAMSSKIANILKTDTMLFHDIKANGMSNKANNSCNTHHHNMHSPNQLTTKESQQRLFQMKLSYAKCPLKQLLKNKLVLKEKTNMVILTIPDKASHISIRGGKMQSSTSNNSRINLQIATTPQNKGKSSLITNLCLPTEPRDFNEFLKLKFKKYISTKSNIKKEERRATFGQSIIMRSKSKEDNHLLLSNHKKSNCLPKLVNHQ